jgi:cation diffusion facilitator family transporter
MAGGCCNNCEGQPSARQGRYRRILWVAFAINLTMFVVEVLSGLHGGSVSLMADSLDFLGDAANYGISLLVLGLSVTVRANASRIKAFSLGTFGSWVIGLAIWNLTSEVVPSAPTMGIVGLSALIANCVVALLLFTYRDGDSNMRSVWLCTRNDALGNVAVLLAALGVFGTGAGWPDLAVAAIMSILALSSAVKIFRQANAELLASAGDSSVASKTVIRSPTKRYPPS